jgi:hypothetical protein
MNVNGVLANRASELLGSPRGVDRLVQPNDAVNLEQSSNDIFPTAMHLAAARAVSACLLPAHDALRAALDDKAQAFADIVKVGRTHLQDATPLTLGQEFSGYATQVEQTGPALQAGLRGLCLLAVGGTAVGGGHRPRHSPRIRRTRGYRSGVAHRARLRMRAQQVRGTGEPRRHGLGPPHPADPRSGAHQNSQRHPLADLGTANPIHPLGAERVHPVPRQRLANHPFSET